MPDITKEQLKDFVTKQQPRSFGALRTQLRAEKIFVSDERLLALVDDLRSEEMFELSSKSPDSLREYLTDIWSVWWFYLVIVIALLELGLVLSDARSGLQLAFRTIFGLGILGLIPGFLTISLIFPGKEIGILEKIALSIVLSVFVSIAIGILLGIGPFFQASTNIIALTVYVLLADIVAGYRNYEFLRRHS